MDYSTIKEILVNQILTLFPDESRRFIIYQSYKQHLTTLKILLPYLNKNTKAKILDVGTGIGEIPLVLQRAGYECTAIDTWQPFHETNKHILGTEEDIISRLQRNGIRTEYCDIEKEPFPFKSNSFDIVLFTNVIEHLHSSPKRPLSEIRRVLKNKGILILSTPNLANLKNRLLMMVGLSNHVNIDIWYNCNPYFGHIREYTSSEIRKILKLEGFITRHTKLTNCLQIPPIQSFKSILYALIMTLYLSIVTPIPIFQYLMSFVAQKSQQFK